MKRRFSAIMAVVMIVSMLNSISVMAFSNGQPWSISFNNTGEVSKTGNSGADRIVDAGYTDPNNPENSVGILKSGEGFTPGADISLYKTLAGNQGAFYSTSGATASAGSGVTKMDLYFEDTAVLRKTAPRFAYITNEGNFVITGNFNTFNLIFDTDGNIKQNLQASQTSTVNTSAANYVTVGSYETGRWYRLVQRLDTVKQILEIEVYDLTAEDNPFDQGRIRNMDEVFQAAPVATAKYYVGYGGLEEHSATDTGDNRSKGATVLGISGMYMTATIPANTASTMYTDNWVAGPSSATAQLAVVDMADGEASLLDSDMVLPSDFIGRTIQLRFAQPVQNSAAIDRIKIKKISTGEEIIVPRNEGLVSSYRIADLTAPQIMEFTIPENLEENASYEIELTNIKDIHGRSFENLRFNCVTEEFIESLQTTAEQLEVIVSQQNEGLDLNAVKGNITLPTETDEGIEIHWIESTDSDTLSIDGTVVCPPFSENEDTSKEVTLTAVVSKSGVSLTREVQFIVKMQDASLEYYVLKAAYEHFAANFTIQDHIITEAIEFPISYESPEYEGVPVSLSYEVKGRGETSDIDAQGALSISKDSSTVNRIMGAGQDVLVEIIVTFSLEGEADRTLTIPATIPHKNLLSGLGKSVLTDGRPTSWQAAEGEEHIIDLGKKIVIGELYAVGTDSDKADFYVAVNGEWEKVEDDFPYEASKIKLVMSGAPLMSISEVEAYASDRDRAIIDIEKAEIKDNIKNVTAKSIHLPFEGEHGTKFSWSSSKPSVIDQYGTVTATNKDETVVLTVTAKDSDLSDISKTFTVTVNKKTSSSSGGGGGGGGNRGGSSINVTVPVSPPNVSSPQQPGSPERKFEDMDQAQWAEKYVDYLTEKEILNGRGNRNFAPNDSILREEFVKIVLLAFDFDLKAEGSHTNFEDVATDAWYYEYIQAATAAGIIKGKGHVFGVGERITREDMAVILLRAITAKGAELAKVKAADFEDIEIVKDYAKEAVIELAEAGIFSGYEDQTIRPQRSASRAETAKLVYSVLEALEKIE